MTLQITDTNLEEVLQTDKLVVIDFYADWCGPCKTIGPIINEVSKEYKDKVVIGKVDVDNNDEAATKYNIRNIPTILFIKNGEIVDKVVGVIPKVVGATPKELLIEKINQFL